MLIPKHDVSKISHIIQTLLVHMHRSPIHGIAYIYDFGMEYLYFFFMIEIILLFILRQFLY